jgi:hypothetical protein
MGIVLAIQRFVPKPFQCCVFMRAMTLQMVDINTQLFLRYEGSMFDVHPPGVPPLYPFKKRFSDWQILGNATIKETRTAIKETRTATF